MAFRVRLLAYLLLYSALDTAKPDIINQGLPTTRPGLLDEGMYTRTSRKLSNVITEGITATISNDAGRVSQMVHSADDTASNTTNTRKVSGGTVRKTVDTVTDSDFTVQDITSTKENSTEWSGVIVIDHSVTNTISKITFVDQTTPSDETSTDAPVQDENDITGTTDREGYFLARKVIMWGFTPIFVVVGFTCNCITAHALRAMTSSGSSTSYLRALAVADAVYNLLGVYLTIGVVLEDVGYESVRDFNVYAYQYQWLFLHTALNRISSGLTVLLSFERFLAVFFPFYIKQAFLTRRPLIVITVSTIVIFVFFFVNIFRYEAREVVDPVTGRSRMIPIESQFGRDHSSFIQGYLRFGYIIFGVIPIFLVFFLNVGILIKLRLMQRKRAKMTSAARMRDHQITRSLLLISLMFLLTNIPVLVILSIGKLKFSERFRYRLMADLLCALGNLNSASNFFILTLCCSAFRSGLLVLFRRRG